MGNPSHVTDDVTQWRNQKFFTGCVTPIGSTLQSSTDALHCFRRERNFDRRMRHHLPHFLNGNFTEVAEMHMANTRRRHIAGGSTHSFNFLDEELGKFVGVNVS